MSDAVLLIRQEIGRVCQILSSQGRSSVELNYLVRELEYVKDARRVDNDHILNVGEKQALIKRLCDEISVMVQSLTDESHLDAMLEHLEYMERNLEAV